MGPVESIIFLIIAGIAAGAIALHGSNNPQILVDIEDDTVVICDTSDVLDEKLADAGISQSDISMLVVMDWGKEVQVKDVRTLNDRIKDKVAKPIVWDAICHSIEREILG